MTVANTSRESLAHVPLRERQNLSDQIHDVVAAALRNGAKDVSMREVQDVLWRVHGKRVDMSSISGRVNDLVAAKRLVRDTEHARPCQISGREIHPLSVPAQQGRLCA